MTTSPPAKSETTTPVSSDPDALRAEIAETRAELGDTVDALAAKTDIRGRTQARLADARVKTRQAAARARITVRAKTGPAVSKARGYTATARQTAADSSPRTRTLSAAGGAAVLLLVLVSVRRRRRAAAKTPWYRR